MTTTKVTDFESVTGEEETQIIAELKSLLRDVVLAEGFYSGIEKPSHFSVYALLELAAEIAYTSEGNSLFIDAAHEVDDRLFEELTRTHR